MPPPERIGRYRVAGELGQGAMGTVYRAVDDVLEREVAVKVMSRSAADADARARFMREARAAAKLQHPNIVVIYELGEHMGAPFMALELLDGVDLQRAIRSGLRPDPKATVPLVLQLLAGLGHAHEHGIVHRDVKPSNLFLPLGRPAKILDFGVARLSGVGTHTGTGAMVGTPNYMSPEQVSSGELDGRSDLFSAGLILYELVTGEKAIQADSVISAIYRILHETPDLSVLPSGPGWPALRAVLERALAREPDARYPDARTMARELAQALVELGGTVDPLAPADRALIDRPKPRPKPAVMPTPRPVATPRPGAPGPLSGNRPLPPTTVAPLPSRGSWRGVAFGGTVVLAIAAAGWLALARRVVPGPSPAAAPTAPVPPSLAPEPQPSTSEATASQRPSPRSGPSPAAASPAEPRPREVPATDAERLARARDLIGRSRWAEALAEARAVLDHEPTNAEAASLAEQAEAETVIEDCLSKARAALRAGDRERALDEVRRGFAVRKDDPRLLALHREAVQQ
ncbi:MAG TPA: protein kinase [Vicinamibacteria bacterium]|nr:protein kinase [Vicinamibacteria bacterium]